jgi:ABC-type amino acid transport substrate-binding protein
MTSNRASQCSRPHSSRKRVLTAMFALSLAIAACGGEGSDGDAESTADDVTVNSGTLTIGSDLTYPPYAFLDGEEPSGFDADMGRALAEEMGLEAEFDDTRFEQLIAGLQGGTFDIVLSALYITSERAEVIDYIPYTTTGTSIIVRSDDEARPATPEDLCGMRVASISGSAILPDLRGPVSDECVAAGEDPLDIREFPTDPEATQALVAGNADVLLTDAAVAQVTVDRQDGVEISSTEILYPIPVGIGLQQGSDELQSAVESALDALREGGRYQELLDKYNLEEPDPALVESALEGEA